MSTTPVMACVVVTVVPAAATIRPIAAPANPFRWSVPADAESDPAIVTAAYPAGSGIVRSAEAVPAVSENETHSNNMPGILTYCPVMPDIVLPGQVIAGVYVFGAPNTGG